MLSDNFGCSPDWPRYAAHSPEIWAYLDTVCKTFDLRRYMTFNTEIIGCYWSEEEGQWTVKMRQTDPGSTSREFEEKCDILLHATGILNNFKWPEIEGLKKFKGKVVRKFTYIGFQTTSLTRLPRYGEMA